MTKIRFFTPQVRLKRLLAESGGVAEAVALERAHTRMESIKADCLKGLDDKIEEIDQLARTKDDLSRRRSYDCSNDVFAISGAYGLAELSEVAHSLCTLLAAPETAVGLQSVRVHVDTMRALRRPEISSNAQLRATVLRELKALSARLASDSPE